MAGPIHITHFIAFCGAAQGGPVNSLATLTEAQVLAGDRVDLFTTPLPSDGPTARFATEVHVHQVLARAAMGYRWAPTVRTTAKAALAGQAGPAVIHTHSLWTDIVRHAGGLARELGRPHIISPCGTLTRDALRFKGWKKKPIWHLYQRRVLEEAFCLHAKSGRELEDIRSVGLKNPVAVVPNPIRTPRVWPPEGLIQTKRSSTVRTVLYLGRLHPVKGLERLITAWSALGENSPGKLVLAGPDEAGYRAELERMVQAKGIGESVTFTGELDEQAKWRALHDADIFIMPSDFENFGSAIAEAAWAGKPIITTHGTPWKSVQLVNAGWWIPATADSLTTTLTAALELPIADLQQMGQNARELATAFEANYVAQQMRAVYEWALGSGPMPPQVVL